MEPSVDFRRLVLAALSLLVLTGCADRKNREAAQRALHRLSPDMSCADACWFAGTEAPENCTDWTYEGDYGQSLSRKEYTLRMWVRGGKLVRADVIKPRYEGHTRRGGEGEVIEERGLPIDQIPRTGSGG